MKHPQKAAEIEARRRLVAAGIRTIGFGFDGSGDSGSVQEICFPDDAALPLEECGSPSDFTPAYTFSGLGVPPYAAKAEEYKKKVDSLVQMSVLEDIAYAALEFFPGDWVNNDGGYGTVAIDLLTGEFNIDGYQRYMEVSAADQSGSVGEPLDETAGPDVMTVVRSTLGVT
jgi:hypothetical protein